jgi:hypothetical protein
MGKYCKFEISGTIQMYLAINSYRFPCDPSTSKSCPYFVFYAEQSGGFAIGLLNPLGKNRREAEQYLMKKLGLPKNQMCQLRYQLTTDVNSSQEYAGVDLKFSFCPGAVALK